jgi:hypothetical protein
MLFLNFIEPFGFDESEYQSDFFISKFALVGGHY